MHLTKGNNMKIRQFLAAFLVLICASPGALSHNPTNYPTLSQPVRYEDAYTGEVNHRADQTQAAILLILYNLLSPVEGISEEDVISPEHLESLGLNSNIYAARQLSPSRVEANQLLSGLTMQDQPFTILPDNYVSAQLEAVKAIRDDPSFDDIIRLAAISSLHPDPLVRLAAAPILYLYTDRSAVAIRDIEAIARLPDYTLYLIGNTLLARLTGETQAAPSIPLASPLAGNSKTVVVHGTGASKSWWWRQTGDFFEYLEYPLQIADLYFGDQPYSWSGAWTHEARLAASQLLNNWAAANNADCLNIMSHSHGSNVALLASKYMKMGRMVLMATPIHKEKYAPSDEESIYSIRVYGDLAVFADGGANETPDDWGATDLYVGWFNHSAPHERAEWIEHDIYNQLPALGCTGS